MKQYLLLAVLFLSAVGLAFSFTVDIPGPSWEEQKLANSTLGFVELEIGDDRLHIVHRNAGLEYLGKEKPLFSFMDNTEWKSNKIDERESAGSYLSMSLNDEGTLMVSYQYAEIAEEELKYAERMDGNWSVSDNLAEQVGLNTGMYSEVIRFKDKPVVFYSDDQNQKLEMAILNGLSVQSRSTLEQSSGLSTNAEKCGGEIYVGFRDRDSNTVNIGTYDGEWSSRSLNATATALDFELEKDCKPVIVYHSDSENRVKIWRDGEKKEVGKSQFTRISADTGEKLRYLYKRRLGGLRYSVEDENTTILDQNREAGDYHDLEVNNGNIHLAYTNGSNLLYAEYNVSEAGNKRALLNSLRASLIAGILVSVYFIWRRIEQDN